MKAKRYFCGYNWFMELHELENKVEEYYDR